MLRWSNLLKVYQNILLLFVKSKYSEKIDMIIFKVVIPWHNSNITAETCCDNVAQEKNVLMSQKFQNMSQGKKKKKSPLSYQRAVNFWLHNFVPCIFFHSLTMNYMYLLEITVNDTILWFLISLTQALFYKVSLTLQLETGKVSCSSQGMEKYRIVLRIWASFIHTSS